jgi:hypothetical protein
MVEYDDGPAVGHVPLADPAKLAALAERWGNCGAFILCVSANCLADPRLAVRWPVTAPGQTFVLVEVELARFVPRRAAEGRTVVAVPLRVDDTGDRRAALLFTADDGHVWWLALADDVTTRLVIEYLRGQLGASLHTDQEGARPDSRTPRSSPSPTSSRPSPSPASTPWGTRMPDDPLNPFLEAAGIEPGHVGPNELAALGTRVTTGSLEEFILHPARMSGLIDDQERPPDYFEIHDREWWIDARRPAARAYLITLIAAAAVGDALALGYTLWWIIKVLPATVTVERAVVDENAVRLTLCRRRAPELPADLAEDINPQDFAEFVDALTGAAQVVPLPVGGTMTFTDE